MNPPIVAIPHPPHSTGPYFPRVWAQVAAYAPPGTVVLVRIPGTYEARVVRTETEYRLLAAGLTMPECYVTIIGVPGLRANNYRAGRL